MKRALIVGVSGQDGAYLSKLLLEKGYEVWGSSRDVQTRGFGGLKSLGVLEKVKLVSMATNDFRSVFQGLSKVCPDEIYNLAGQSSVGLSFEQPVEAFESIGIASLNLLETIRMLNKPVKFYNAASTECFGDTAEIADERSAFHPRSPYAVAKCAAFMAVANYREAYGLFACNGILSNHESPLRPKRFVTGKIVDAARRIASGERMKLHLGRLDIQRDWGWAPEYVEAMWLMLQRETPDDFLIATGETHALSDFVEAAFSSLGLDWKEHVVSDPSLQRPSDIAFSRLNPAKAGVVLNWRAKRKMREVASMMARASDGAGGES